jgi:putative peptidoglycan lipid II flippase
MLTYAALAHETHPDVANITTTERWVLAVGTTLGVIAMTVALWPSLRRTGFRWHFVLDIHDAALRRIVRLSGWLFFYVLVNQLGYIVVIMLANRAQGGYTAYSYAYIFFQLPYAIFAVSVFTALLPPLSSRWLDRDVAGYRSLLSLGLRVTALVALPAAAGYIALASPIIHLLLQHGRTTPAGADLVSGTLVLFATGLLSFSLFQLLLRGFYAMQDTRTPALINLGATALGTAVNFIYFRYLGVKGLALGQTTAYTIAAIAALLVIRSRLGSIDGRRLAGSMSRIAVAAVGTGLAAALAAVGLGTMLGTATPGAQLVQVLGGVVAGLAVFVGIARVLQIEEVSAVTQLLRRRNQ